MATTWVIIPGFGTHQLLTSIPPCRRAMPSLKGSEQQFLFHIRAMRQAAFEKYGLVSPSVKKAVLRYMYKDFSWRCVRCCYHQSRSLDLHCFSFFQHSFINDPIANKIRPFKSLIILELVLACSFYLQQI